MTRRPALGIIIGSALVVEAFALWTTGGAPVTWQRAAWQVVLAFALSAALARGLR